MRLLLDTHLLLWTKLSPKLLPQGVQELILGDETKPEFSVASIWEIAIKQSQGRRDFNVDAAVLRSELLATGYSELRVLGEHATAVASLPWIHKDPFDRLLVAQAMVEGIELLTVDATLARYPGPIRLF
jgi:PIN domain nuclease of toxin-antitoxin system